MQEVESPIPETDIIIVYCVNECVFIRFYTQLISILLFHFNVLLTRSGGHTMTIPFCNGRFNSRISFSVDNTVFYCFTSIGHPYSYMTSVKTSRVLRLWWLGMKLSICFRPYNIVIKNDTRLDSSVWIYIRSLNMLQLMNPLQSSNIVIISTLYTPFSKLI